MGNRKFYFVMLQGEQIWYFMNKKILAQKYAGNIFKSSNNYIII